MTVTCSNSCAFSLAFGLLIGVSCSSHEKSEEVNDGVNDTGEALAKKYCGSCHLFPAPDLLDKKTWRNHTLPAMGYRFGIYKDRIRDSLLEQGAGGRIVAQANIFPERQLISDEEWQLIGQYFYDHAPDELVLTGDTLLSGNTAFKAAVPDLKIARPAISALAYDEKKRRSYVADCSREDYSSVIILDSLFKPVTSLGLPHPVSNLTLRSDTLYILMMGHFVPSDEPAGQLVRAIRNEDDNYEGYQRIVKELKRPVDIAYADLDNNGTDDFVVCEFGNHTGSVSLFTRQAKHTYAKKILLNAPGAIKVSIEDINNDAQKDILVLMAQGDEGLDIYFNQGNGRFQRSRVLNFPPVYGSASFCLADMNKDGYKDIVYVNGDNADASQVLKPYHGIRIFMNDFHNRFTESYFYPMPGAYKATVRDFDKDGDIDIAAVSFFPDFANQPERGFVYLENISEHDRLIFAPSAVEASKDGRWITMMSGDFDLDGYEDLVLGAFTSMSISGDTLNVWKDQYAGKSVPLLVLKNITAEGRLKDCRLRLIECVEDEKTCQ